MQKSYWIENLYADDVRGFDKQQGANRNVTSGDNSGFPERDEHQIVDEPPYRSMHTLVETSNYADAGNHHNYPEYQAAPK